MEPLTTPHLFRDARQIRALSPGVYTALRESESGAAYDRKAAIYDAVVGWPRSFTLDPPAPVIQPYAAACDVDFMSRTIRARTRSTNARE